MYKLCKTQQSATRQRQLELGLLQAMLEQHYEEVSVSDLCDRMQIPRKSFYRYFSGKDGALRALIDHTLLEFQEVFGEPVTTHSQIHAQLEKFFLFWVRNKELLDALAQSNIRGVLIERAITHALNDYTLVHHFTDENRFMTTVAATRFAVCGLMSIVLSWHDDNFKTSISQMTDIAVEIMTNPLYKI